MCRVKGHFWYPVCETDSGSHHFPHRVFKVWAVSALSQCIFFFQTNISVLLYHCNSVWSACNSIGQEADVEQALPAHQLVTLSQELKKLHFWHICLLFNILFIYFWTYELSRRSHSCLSPSNETPGWKLGIKHRLGLGLKPVSVLR